MSHKITNAYSTDPDDDVDRTGTDNDYFTTVVIIKSTERKVTIAYDDGPSCRLLPTLYIRVDMKNGETRVQDFYSENTSAYSRSLRKELRAALKDPDIIYLNRQILAWLPDILN